MTEPLTVLCLASYFKGHRLLEAYKSLGCRTVLVADAELRDEPWSDALVDESFFMPDVRDVPALTRAVSYLAQDRVFHAIVPLEEYMVDVAASLREHLRCPGMGATTSRYVRDKLAMRMQAAEHGIRVPAFVHALNRGQIRDYLARVPPPWLVKPRSEGGAVQIAKCHDADELWEQLARLGGEQSFHLVESFVPGGVCHVDSVVSEREVVFAAPSRYGRPPFSIWNEGGVFSSSSIPADDPLAAALLACNRATVEAMGVVRGVTHAEFIHGRDGHVYFLEIAARVAGANLDRVVEAATGVNLSRELARLDVDNLSKRRYAPPAVRRTNATLLICLARRERPDLHTFDAPEVVWRLEEGAHAGLILASDDRARLDALAARYTERLEREVLAVAPPTAKPM